jgi:class 3 adenylate cyclase
MVEVAQTVKTADKVNALLLHVRSNPGEHDPGHLAKQFQVPEALVREIVSQRRQGPKSRRTPRKPSSVKAALLNLVDWTDHAFDKLISKPTLFLFLSTAVAFGITYLIKQFSKESGDRAAAIQAQTGGLNFGLTWEATASLFVVLTFIAVHMVAFFRWRQVRYPLIAGGLVFFIFSMVAFTGEVRTAMPSGVPLSANEIKVLILIGCFVMGFLYAGLGSLVSVAGGWLHMTSEERKFRSMSRLEMLERYFEVEEALERAPDLSDTEKRTNSRLIEVVRGNAVAWIIGLALVNGILTISLYATFGVNPADKATPPIQFLLLSMLLSLSALSGFGFIVWQAPTIPKAVLLALVYNAIGSLIYYVPITFPGRDGLLKQLSPAVLALSLATYAVMGAVIGLASKIARHARTQAGVKSGDPTALVRELVRLEEKLMVDTGRVCVMSVDVAGSTLMKAGADPMDAEYSFAAYQVWVSEVCRRKGGRVHSTAGDGAIVSFGDAKSAFEAGCVLQVGVAWLNQERNRLSTPFKLRVGLHEGEVAADLDKLQFTRVIDVAAHVESVSPVGGLAVTEEVAGQLTDVPWVLLPDPMDGHRVFTLGSDVVPRFGGSEPAQA